MGRKKGQICEEMRKLGKNGARHWDRGAKHIINTSVNISKLEGWQREWTINKVIILSAPFKLDMQWQSTMSAGYVYGKVVTKTTYISHPRWPFK